MAAQEEKGAKQPWRRPTLKYVGHVGDVLQQGGGKLTPSRVIPVATTPPRLLRQTLTPGSSGAGAWGATAPAAAMTSGGTYGIDTSRDGARLGPRTQ